VQFIFESSKLHCPRCCCFRWVAFLFLHIELGSSIVIAFGSVAICCYLLFTTKSLVLSESALAVRLVVQGLVFP